MSGRRIPNFDPIAEALGLKPDAYGAERAAAIARAARDAGDDGPVPVVPRGRPVVRLSHRTRDYCPKGPGHRWVVIAKKDAAGFMLEACEACEPERFVGLSTIHPDNRDRLGEEHVAPPMSPEDTQRLIAAIREGIRNAGGAGRGTGRKHDPKGSGR